jgi:cytochrome P450
MLAQQRWLIAAGKEQLTDADTELLGTTTAAAKFVHDNRALMLFGAGPRVCPGQYLAVTDIKVSEAAGVCFNCYC